MSVIYLDLPHLLLIAERIVADPKVRDHGLLEAAVARPRTEVFGVEAYPRLSDKAAALMHSLVNNHALVDGNKRLGWAATVVFCDINGVWIEMPDDDAYDLVIAVAEGRFDLADIAARLRAAGVP